MLSVGLLLACLVAAVHGHGKMIAPIGRSSMWRYGYDVPENWDDNEINCGGFDNHWQTHGGLCGVCGDAWQGPRENEAGGKYASGIIATENHYTAGQVIEVELDILVNHYGWNEWHLCVHNDVNTPITQECLDENLLELADGSGTRLYFHEATSGSHIIPLRLPEGVTCEQCVLKWTWVCGNRWGCSDDCLNPDPNNCGIGCGEEQEHFYSCADITIS